MKKISGVLALVLVLVSAADKSSGKRKQSISIEYDFIGFIPLNELMQKKTA